MLRSHRLHLPWLPQSCCSLWTWTCESVSPCAQLSLFLCSLMLLSHSHVGVEEVSLACPLHSQVLCRLQTFSHPFFPLNLRAAPQLSRRDKVTGTQSTSTWTPTFLGCRRESAMVDLSLLIPTSLPSPPCPLHFKLKIFSLSRGPEKGLSSHMFQGDMGCCYLLSISFCL